MNQPITNKRSKFIAFLIIFAGIALFQLTELRYIWGITGVSRFYNIFFVLIFSIYIIFNIYTKRLNSNVWFYYMLPGILIFSGYFINITMNTLREQSLAIHYGSLVPWLTYLAVPFLLKDNIINAKSLLRYYYYLTLLIATLGLLDYFLYFNGFINLQALDHPQGRFLTGWFSIFHMLEEGVAYYRFYASMGEPGNLAMILLPSVIYSIIYKRYLGVFIFIFSIYLSASLGGFIGIGMAIFLLLIVFFRKSYFLFFVSIFSLILILSVVLSNWNKIYSVYEEKGNSRITRELNVVNSIKNLPSILINNPLGINFSINYSENTSEDYYGSNFMPLNAIYKGGIFAGIGYIIIINIFFLTATSCFFRKKRSREDITSSLSIIVILPFIVQRHALLETSMLILVLTPFIIKSLGSYGEKHKSVDL
jgi:hypothetical protein